MTSGGVRLDKFSVGVGDRFAHQAKAQLEACVRASRAGVEVVPVWNKSNREHNLIGSEPSSTRAAADAAVKALHWTKSYYCDADHINLQTVGRFLASSDLYTIDVSDFIGRKTDQSSIDTFVRRHSELVGEIKIEGVEESFEITPRSFCRSRASFSLPWSRPYTVGLNRQRGKTTSFPKSPWMKRTLPRRRWNFSSFWLPPQTRAFRCKP